MKNDLCYQRHQQADRILRACRNEAALNTFIEQVVVYIPRMQHQDVKEGRLIACRTKKRAARMKTHSIAGSARCANGQ